MRIDWADANAVTQHTIYRRQDGGEWEPIAENSSASVPTD